MTRLLWSILVVLLIVPGLEAQPSVVLHQTYNADTVGQAPGLAEIGGALYFGSGTHTVIDTYGSPAMRSVDSSTSDGFAVQWVPTANPTIFEASFQFRIESSTSTVGSIIQQNFTLNSTSGTQFARLHWKHDGDLEVGGVALASKWNPNTLYSIRLKVDCTVDQLNLWINGVAQAADQALGFDCTTLHSFNLGADFATTVTTVIDEVRVVAGDSIFFDGFESGNTAQWSATEPPPPSGDQCNSAIPFTSGTLLGDLLDNTASGVTDSCGQGNTVDEWVSYDSLCDGTLTVTTCHPGTQFDSVLSVWDGCQGATELACNDDAAGAPPECELSGSNRKSTTTLPITSGTTYYFRISAFQDTVPSGGLEISAICGIR